LPRKAKKRKRRVVVDTSVLVAGISGFKDTYVPSKNPSADALHKWVEERNFIRLISEDILDEYKEVLKRLRVRPHLIGRIVNLIREATEEIKVRYSVYISPDPGDDPLCLCAEQGKADFLLTLNTKDFPQEQLGTRVLSPVDFF
jgi:predicted nucleic acid-binding protein